MYENIAVAKINKAVNGIELSFNGKPAYDVLKDLKENGFRWHYKKQIWYARNTADNVKAVEKYVDLDASDSSFGVTPGGTVDVRALRNQRLGIGLSAPAITSAGADEGKEAVGADIESGVVVYSAIATMRDVNDAAHEWECLINGRCVSLAQAEKNAAQFRKMYGVQIVKIDITSQQITEIPKWDEQRLNTSMQDWYLEHFPQDEDMAEIWKVSDRKSNTFRDLFQTLDACDSVYEVLPSGADSIVRERLFAEFSSILGCDYGIVYQQWIDGERGGLTKLVGALESAAPELAEKYDLGFGHLGNGITVWNRLEEEHGDYKTVAHISAERAITFYDKAMPETVKQKIRDFAEKANPTISATQNQLVFHVPAKVLEQEKESFPQDKGPGKSADKSEQKLTCLADVYGSVGRGDILRDSTVEGSLWSPVSGRGYYADINACVYCNREAAYVVELDNAMKRGKECKHYSIYARGQDIHLYLVNECNVRTPKDLYGLVRSGKELPDPGVLSIREEKGVEVFSPFVPVKPLKELPEKWKKGDLVKAIMSGQVFSGVLDQRLTDDYAYDAAVNFGTGRPIDLAGQAYDLVEGCRDCYIRTDGVDENGIASVHFSYAGDMKTFLFDVNCDLAEGVRRREAAAHALEAHNAELRATVISVKESDIDPNKVYVVDKLVEDSNTGKIAVESEVVQGFALVDRLGLDEITEIRDAELVPNKLYQVANFFDRRDHEQEDSRIIDTGNWGQVASGKAIEELTTEGVYLHLKTPDYENPRSFEAVKQACMEFVSGNSRFLFGNAVDYSRSLQKLEAEEARLYRDKSVKREFSSLSDIIGFAEIKKEFERNQGGLRVPESSRDSERDLR